MKIVLIIGVLLAAAAIGLACLVGTAADDRETVRGDNPKATTESRGLSSVTAGAARKANASPRRLAKQNGLLGTVVLPGLAGAMTLTGIGLLLGSLRNRLPKRHRHRYARTAVLVKNAGQRRRREMAVPATVSFSLANQPIRADQTSAPHGLRESEQIETLRRVG